MVAVTDGPDGAGDDGRADEVGPSEGVRFGAGMLAVHDATPPSAMARAAAVRSRPGSVVRGLSHGYSFVSLASRGQRRGRTAAALTLRMTGQQRYSVASLWR
jgi:hypothetical protein